MADFSEQTNDQMANPNVGFRESSNGNQDVNSNPEEIIKIGQNLSDYVAHEQEVPYPHQGVSPSPLDPMMRQAYARPPAGLVTPQHVEQSPSRQYKMASDIFGTGMDKSWTASPGSLPTFPNNVPANPISGTPSQNQNVPNSFKITEMPSNNTAGNDEQSGGNPAGRRARESSGNPLTGQGFNPENTKTGKRYFEGSNANSKLW